VKLTPEGTTTGRHYPALVEFGGCMAEEDCGGPEGIEELMNGGEAQEVDRDGINLILEETFSE
jgi:hypothetical protein